MKKILQKISLGLFLIFSLMMVSNTVYAQIASPNLGTGSCVSLTQLMKKGSTDATAMGEVSVLQQFLVNSGYLTPPVDGKFGPMTHTAVVSFQNDNGLVADGIVGSKSRATIQILTCGANPQIPNQNPNQGLNNSGNTTVFNPNPAPCGAGILFNTLNGQPCPPVGPNPVPNSVVSNLTNIVCSPGTDPYMVVVSPKGGETFATNQQIDVIWKACNPQAGVDISINLVNETNFSPLPIVHNLIKQTPNDGTETVTLSPQNGMPPFQTGTVFKVRLSYIFTPNYTGQTNPSWANYAYESAERFTIQ